MSYLSLYEIDDDGRILKDLSGEQRRETEKELRALIGQPEDFMMTSFAAQGSMNNFIAQGPTERKKTISNFMGLDVYDQMQLILKEDSAGVKSLLKRLDVKDWVAETRNEKQNICELERRKDDLETEIHDFRARYSLLKDQANEQSGGNFIDPAALAHKKKSLNLKTKQLTDIKSNLVVLEKEKMVTIRRLEKYITIRDSFPLESYKRRSELLSDLKNSLHKMSSKFDKEKTLMCSQNKSVKLLKEVPCEDQFPTCKFIKESHKNKLLLQTQKNLVGSLKDELSEAKEKVAELETEGLLQKINRYDQLVKNISSLEMKKVIAESNIGNDENQKNILEGQIAKIKTQIAEMELKSIDDKSVIVKKLQDLLQALDLEIESKKSELFENLRQIGQSTARIKRFQEESLEYDRLQVEWKVYDFLLKATSWRGIPTYIMSRQMPIINAELAKILQDVAGFTVELQVDERNTDIFINYGDSRRPIECGSGMEKMVSSMSLRVALGNVSNLNKSDMFIVDEGFGSLDPQNIEAVATLLRRLKKYYRLIIIISHIDVVKDSVDDVIEITKKGKDSKVVYA
jgi:DNA repair exonuclease SbcCD ATPase subunit